MRKNILFVARFDNVLKGTNAILSKTFNMQICPPTPDVVEKTLDVVEMDLLLFYISGISNIQITSICDKIEKANIRIPIVVFGSSSECADFSNTHIKIHVKKYLCRPLAAGKIVQALCALLDVDFEAPEPDVIPKMSIADFANSLESDERRLVLVVDDSGVILRAMKLLLEKKYRVNLANSAMSAIASIKRERPDAVLLDYEMPEHSGKEALEMIRNNNDTRTLPVFFLTGVSDKERIKDVLALRPQGYFLKNSDPGIILDALEKCFKELN